MGSSILNIGVTGLNAAQAGLLTTGHNISNASTPGYNRQQIVQSANTPLLTGSGFFGQGTNVQTVKRVYSQFLSAQVTAAETQAEQLSTYSDQIAQIDNLLADPSAGLSPSLQAFFKSVQEMAANPASIPARQAVLSSAQGLVSRFRGLDQRMTEVREGTNSRIAAGVSAVNSFAQQIADLNERITVASSAAGNQPPNDLLDQRDQLLADLNKEIRVTTTADQAGNFNVFIGNGQALVVGKQTSTLVAVQAADDAARIEVGIVTPTGSSVSLQESMITGGKLGGLVAFRRETLDPAQNALGRIAIGFARTFNDQHRLGQDLGGALGGDFYAPFAAFPATASKLNTSGATVDVSITAVSQLTTSDYRLSYDGSNYTLVRLADNKSWSAATLGGVPPTGEPQGFSLAASGALASGDSFLVRPTRSGARDIALTISDPRNIAAAAPIRSGAAAANTGTGKISAGSVSPGLPLAANLRQPVTITFNDPPTTFNVSGTGTGNPTNIAYTPGSDISYNGWTVQINGTPAATDAFTVISNTGAVADNRNALRLGQLQTEQTLVGGSASYQSAYSQLVSEVGNKARETEVTLTAQENLVKQATDTMQSMSGVNLDEEATNLLRYQQAYQASARMIDIAGKLFDELIGIGR